MSSDQSLLAEAVNELVAIYVGAPANRGRSAAELQEPALAWALDTVLNSMFRVLGSPVDTSIDSPAPAIVERLEVHLARMARHKGGFSFIAGHLGATVEYLRGKRLVVASNGKCRFETSPDRRDNGVYFTPVHLADALVRPALTKALSGVQTVSDLRRFSMVDPAVGCGAFLLAAVRLGAEMLQERPGFKRLSPTQVRAEFAAHCVFGVDIDPLAIAMTRALLRAQVGSADWDTASLDRHLRVGDSIATSLSGWAKWFPTVCPRGFDLVVTNPPWSKLRPLRHEFFEHIDARVRQYQGTELGRYLDANLRQLVEGPWADHVARTIDLSQRLKHSSEYSMSRTASGDQDLYKYFTERSLALLQPEGVAALLLPSGILRAQGTGELRRYLLARGRVELLTEYINRQKLFDIHSMYRFCTLVFQKGAAGGIQHARFRIERTDSTEFETLLELSPNFLGAVGGSDRLIPEVRTLEERNLLRRFYKLHRTPGHPEANWSFSFRRELDMTNDAHAFVSVSDAASDGYRPQADGRWQAPGSQRALLPLYEGRMVHQFDSGAKSHISGQGRSARWEVTMPGTGYVRPHYLVGEDYARGRGWRPQPKVGYCEISGHANERTLLAAALPTSCVCGNKVPVLQLERESSGDSAFLWLALANSLTVDWIMRRWVSTTINHFYWQNIPLPCRGARPEEERFLVAASRKLSEPHSAQRDPVELLGTRALLRAAMDAVVMNLYEVTAPEAAIILADFPQLQRAHLRGPAGSLQLDVLLQRARRGIGAGRFHIEDLERVVQCRAVHAAAAYTPNEQSFYLASSAIHVEQTNLLSDLPRLFGPRSRAARAM